MGAGAKASHSTVFNALTEASSVFIIVLVG